MEIVMILESKSYERKTTIEMNYYDNGVHRLTTNHSVGVGSYSDDTCSGLEYRVVLEKTQKGQVDFLKPFWFFYPEGSSQVSLDGFRRPSKPPTLYNFGRECLVYSAFLGGHYNVQRPGPFVPRQVEKEEPLKEGLYVCTDIQTYTDHMGRKKEWLWYDGKDFYVIVEEMPALVHRIIPKVELYLLGLNEPPEGVSWSEHCYQRIKKEVLSPTGLQYSDKVLKENLRRMRKFECCDPARHQRFIEICEMGADGPA